MLCDVETFSIIVPTRIAIFPALMALMPNINYALHIILIFFVFHRYFIAMEKDYTMLKP